MKSQAPAARQIVIVGAGISGLDVARRIVADDVRVTVLEARHRVGGRLLSSDDLDLGATWFWPNEPRVQQLVASYGIAVHEQHLDGDAVYHGQDGVQRLEGNPIDVVSRRFANGADSLAQAVADSLPDGCVQLDTEVHSVERRGDGRLAVTSTTPTGEQTIAADHVVLALPPALAVALIDFSPPLPRELADVARITPVWMGGVTKVVIRYADAFWRRAGLSGSGVSNIGPMREVHDMCGVDGEPAALFGFVPAQAVGEPTVERRAVIDQLVAMFGPAAAEPQDVLLLDWRGERFTSPHEVERLTAYQTFGDAAYAHPAIDGRLHWSSTETSRNSPGHIEGALEAAERVAASIIDQLCQQEAPT